MRGQYVPLTYDVGTTSDNPIGEIRRAIDEIRFSVGSEAVMSPDRGVTPKSRETRTDARSQPPGIVVTGPMDELDASTIVSVYGRAPRAFFQWFEELRRQLKDQQQVLEHCRFEEGWWSFDRW